MGLKERKARERDARRNQILAATRELLFEKGLQATSISQIAKRAELGVGTIYFYYQSKEEIFYALQDEGLEILFDQIEAIGRSGQPPEEVLRATGMAYLDFSEAHKNYFDIINYFLSTPTVILGQELKARIDHNGARILELIAGSIQAGIEQKYFRPQDAGKTAVLFWGALHGLTQFKKLEDTVLGGQDHRELYRHAVDARVEGFKVPVRGVKD